MFNLVVTTPRFREEKASEELLELLTDLEINENTEIKITNISGLILCNTHENPFKIVEQFKKILQQSPWNFRYILRVIPIEIFVESKIDIIEKKILSLIEGRINNDQTYKIMIEKRHTNLKSNEIIKTIAPKINLKVNLDKPDWILLIEIIGTMSGISLLKEDQIFSSILEKRNLNLDIKEYVESQ